MIEFLKNRNFSKKTLTIKPFCVIIEGCESGFISGYYLFLAVRMTGCKDLPGGSKWLLRKRKVVKKDFYGKRKSEVV